MNNRIATQHGFSMAEVLIAMLLLSVSLLGLLNYYQVLTYGFMRQWQVQQAWEDAHSQLEACSVTGKGAEILAKGWDYQLSDAFAGKSCGLVSVVVQTPAKYQAGLQRFYCR